MHLCWWCCHNIPKTMLRMPISFDEESKQFQGVGQFCSFPCMKAYNNEQPKVSGNKLVIKMLITQLIQMSQENALINVPNAPPRESLTRFGGTLSIEEFRLHSGSIRLTLPHINTVDYDIERSQKTIMTTPEIKNTAEILQAEFKQSKVINNPLKIKKKNVKDTNISILCMLNNIKNTIDEHPKGEE